MPDTYSCTVEWWTAPAPDGRPRCDLSPAELAAQVGEVGPDGWSGRRKTARANLPGVPFATIIPGRNYRRLSGVRFDAPVDVTPTERVVVNCSKCMTTEEKVERDATVSSLRSQVTELQSRYGVALKDRTLGEYLARTAAGIMPSLKPHAPAPQTPKRRGGRRVEVALLRWADHHADETIDPLIMEGLNRYDPKVYLRRLQYTVDHADSICHERFGGTAYEACVVHDLGDGITGSLHEENKYTNSMPPFVACVFAAEAKARALLDLASMFPRVVYRAVPGNHWRYQVKMPWKMPTETSDWLIAQFIAARVKDVENIEVQAPASWSLVSEVCGHLFSLNHGYSDAKGGYGGVPFYGYMRADGKRSAIDQRLDRRVDYRDYGHIHQKAELPRPGQGHITICPSMCGGNEYAKEGMGGSYSDPAQLLSLVNEDHGEWAVVRLDVARYDDLETCRYDAALDVLSAGR